jgi:hypothetical protein
MGQTYVTNAARIMSGLRETKPLSSMLLRWRALETTSQMWVSKDTSFINKYAKIDTYELR